MNMDNIVSKRTGTIIEIGNSLGVTIRPELILLDLKESDMVDITVYEDTAGCVITIKKLDNRKMEVKENGNKLEKV